MSVTITVEGMSCDHCEQSVEEALSDVDGVQSVTADHESASVTVEGDADRDELVAAVPDNYEASA
jgi:copper chaperone